MINVFEFELEKAGPLAPRQRRAGGGRRSGSVDATLVSSGSEAFGVAAATAHIQRGQKRKNPI